MLSAEPLTREKAERMARIGRVLIDAALKNVCVQTYLRDLLDQQWTMAAVLGNPPVLVEFEHAFVIGGPGEAMAAAKGKPTFEIETQGAFEFPNPDPIPGW